MIKYLTPQWNVSENIKAYSTQRTGGSSQQPYADFNLGIHVGDDAASVQANRDILKAELALPGEPAWLDQVHGTELLYVGQNHAGLPTADAAWTDQPGCVLSVMTADCLPILLSTKAGETVAVVHGGWRGLANGILQKTVATLPARADEIVAWLGPAIGPRHFEVGSEVRDAFVRSNSTTADYFSQSASASDKFYADIFKLGEMSLREAGVADIFGGGVCTFQQSERFFSYRRDGGRTGRMASVIWIAG